MLVACAAHAKQRNSYTLPLSDKELRDSVASYLKSTSFRPIANGDIDVDDEYRPKWMRFEAQANLSIASSYEATFDSLVEWREFVDGIKGRPSEMPKPRLTSDSWLRYAKIRLCSLPLFGHSVALIPGSTNIMNPLK